MYIDLLSQNAQVSVNVKLMQILGINAALYLAVLSDIAYTEVQNGNTSGTYVLNRAAISKRTTLSSAEQDVCDKILERVGILEILNSERTEVGINFDTVTAIVLENDPKNLMELQKKAKVKRGEEKHSKAYYQIQNIKKKVAEKVKSETVLNSINRWLDGLAEMNQAISSQTVDIWISTIDSFTTDDAVKVKIYDLAAMLGMYNVNNAINKYKESTKTVNGSFIGAEQKIGTAVDKNRRF